MSDKTLGTPAIPHHAVGSPVSVASGKALKSRAVRCLKRTSSLRRRLARSCSQQTRSRFAGTKRSGARTLKNILRLWLHFMVLKKDTPALSDFFLWVHKCIFQALQDFFRHDFAFHHFGFAFKRAALNDAPRRCVADSRHASKFCFARAVQHLGYWVLS